MAARGPKGAKRPDLRPSEREQEVAREKLVKSGWPLAPLGVLGASLFAGAGFGLLMMPVLGVLFLVTAGISWVFTGGVPDAVPRTLGLFVIGAIPLWFCAFAFFFFRGWVRERGRLRLIAGGEQDQPRTFAVFRSDAFNTTEEKDTFVNPGCYGDDVVEALHAGLAADGFEVEEEAGAEDFGWYGRFALGEDEFYDLIAAFQPADDEGNGVWHLHVELSGMPLAANRRRRGGRVSIDAVAAVHEVLARTEGVEGLTWYYEPEIDQLDAAA
ncbi:MAG: hypothetical protein AAGB93_14965 [Planctomycetota bacterium]